MSTCGNILAHESSRLQLQKRCLKIQAYLWITCQDEWQKREDGVSTPGAYTRPVHAPMAALPPP